MSTDGSYVMDPENWDGINISSLFSPLYWGTIISMILSGVTIVQAYVYFPSKDHTFVQFLAAAMLCLDVASTVMVAESIYQYIVPHYGSLSPFNSLNPVLAAECGLGAIIVLISQAYFCWQIHGVVRHKKAAKWLIPLAIISFTLLAFVSGVGCTIVMITDKHNVLANRSRRFNIFAGITRSSAAVVDIIATFVLCFYLENARTGIVQTDVMIKTLMQYIIQRGILLSIVQTGVVVCFFASQSRLYWLAFHINVTRLYVNTFFAMLNGRRHLTKRGVISGMSSTIYTGNSHALQSVTHRATKAYSSNSADVDAYSSEYGLSIHDESSGVRIQRPIIRIEKSVKVEEI